MRRSTQRWIGVGVFIAVLFFVGALLVMWATDDSVEQTSNKRLAAQETAVSRAGGGAAGGLIGVVEPAAADSSERLSGGGRTRAVFVPAVQPGVARASLPG